MAKLHVLSITIAIVAILIYSNTKNCRVYEMNQAECVAIQSVNSISRNTLQLIYKITDAIYSRSSNQLVSNEYLAFKHTLKLLDYINPSQPDATQDIFLKKHNKTDNMLQYIVPIPKATKISSQYITVNPITIEKELQIKIRSSTSNTDYSKFYPQNTRIIWIIGDENIDNSSDAKTIIYIHGGSYIFGGPSHMGFASELSIATKTRVVYISYDVPPKVTIPYQVDQVLTVYFYLTMKMKIPTQKIIIAGDSAGGGLSLLSIQKLGSNGLQRLYPNGVILISPWVDLGAKSESYMTNRENDIIAHVDSLIRSGKIAVGNDETQIENGFYSALYGVSLMKLPRMYFVVSRHEILFDDSEQMVAKFKSESNGKVDLKYEIKDYMPHDWLLFVNLFPEADLSFGRLVTVMKDWLS